MAEIESLQDSLAQAESELQTQIDSWQKYYQDKVTETRALKEKLQKSNTEIKQKIDDLDSLKAQNKTLQKKVEDLNQSLAAADPQTGQNGQ